MTNWLERAGREIQKTPRRPTANTDERTLTAVTAVPRLGESGNPRASNGSNGSTPTAGFHVDAQAADLREARTPLSPAALAELPPENVACPWWRVSIVGPRALNIELEMRSAWTVSDWGRFARRHYGPDATVVARLRSEPEPGTEEEQRIQRETSDTGALWWRVAIPRARRPYRRGRHPERTQGRGSGRRRLTSRS